MSNKSGISLKRRLAKIANFLMLFLTIGSCIFIISVINTKDIYIRILEGSQKEYSTQVLLFANSILSTPVLILMIISILAAVGKERYLKSAITKLKVNAFSTVLLLILCILVMQIISYPATSIP
ncbi:MAG: hypothetical protein GY799_05940 [Desulfobulbaceae bacterium]|nr:hypothetical protein [Desulfobulbaceae bacterium]